MRKRSWVAKQSRSILGRHDAGAPVSHDGCEAPARLNEELSIRHWAKLHCICRGTWFPIVGELPAAPYAGERHDVGLSNQQRDC